MRFIPVLAAVAALTATPVLAAPKSAKTATAPAAAPAAGAPQMGETQQHALMYLRVFISALQSDKLEQPVKGALVGCIYNNSLSKLTDSVDKLIVDNPGKVSRDNPSQVLSAMLAVCGYQPEAAAGQAAPQSTAPAAPAAKSNAPATGR